MKIFILHLTDIHFKEFDLWLNDKVEFIRNALKSYFSGYNKAYIVLTGDLAFSGKEAEYSKAKQFLTKVYLMFKDLDPDVRTSVIMVPGNHDCNFKYDSQIRQNTLEKVNYRTIGDKDFSVTDSCLVIQNDFWDFYANFNSLPENRLFYQLFDNVGDTRICFNCYNTAWMSKEQELPGSLFYPIKLIAMFDRKGDSDLSISVFHHPISWINPSTENNNRREFQEYLENNSDILIYGHEHYEEQKKIFDLEKQKDTIYISGQTFQDHDTHSGFQSISIELKEKKAEITNYAWNDSAYMTTKKNVVQLDKSSVKNNKLKIKPEFYDELNKISVPLQIEKVKNLALSDLFVFPDLERISDEFRKLDDYIDSENLISADKYCKCILEGENQSGKSSLLNMLFRRFYERGLFPLLINAHDFNSFNYLKILEKAYNSQYSNHVVFEKYLQTDESKKVLLIDDLQKIKLNKSTTIQLIKELNRLFGRIYISTNSIYGYLSSFESELSEFNMYMIKPLGYSKRNALIELYHRIQESSYTIDDQILLERVKYSFDQVEEVLGNKLLPSYPIYILSILQTLTYSKPIDLEQTSYGYCYQSLIHIALASKAKVPNEKIDSYFNFLTELSYHIYENKQKIISEEELKSFYATYSSKFVTPAYEEIINALIESNILIKEDESYKFSYRYIYYFLVAKKISDIITTPKGKEAIIELCNNLQSEKNANILVFIAHHSKDNFLIESATFASMVPFENIEPITLEKHDKFYTLIKELAEEVSKEVIDINKNPKEVRDKRLQEIDRVERQNELEQNDQSESEEDETIQGDIKTFFQAFKAIEIVGQIIKNRKGSLEKTALLSMIEELYNAGFRSVNFFGQSLDLAKSEIIDSLIDSDEADDSKSAIEKRVNNMFQFLTLQACLGIFSKIVYSVGHKDLRKLFDEVASKLDTPAAKILSFSIKSYYERMSIRELQKLADELKDNRVAIKILRARVRAYVYNNYLDYRSKQKIASSLNMEIAPTK